MSATTYVVATGSIALAASATKSLILINPAVTGLRITELGISFDAATPVVAPRVELYRVTSLGTPAGTTATIAKVNSPLDIAAQSTGLTALSTEPTTVEVLRQWFLQPAGGLFVLPLPLGREPAASGTGGRLGLRVTTAASVTPNAAAYLEWEE